ncbi:hypothetical protein EV122DRAFT_285432 [Schizophyllum commune]
MFSRKYGAPTTSAHAPADPPVNNIDPALLLSSQQLDGMLVNVRRPSPRPTIISDPAGACKIDARTVLNVGDTPLLTSTSSPALPCFDTDVRTPTFNVLERTQRPSRRPPSSPVTPPPSSPSTLAFSTPSTTLLTSLNSAPSTPSSLSWVSSWPRSSKVVDSGNALNVALLDVAVATLAICGASRTANRSSATTRQHDGDDETARGRRRPGKTSSTS